MFNNIEQVNLWDLRKGDPPKGYNGLIFRYLENDKIGTSGNDWGYISEFSEEKRGNIRPQGLSIYGASAGERAALLKFQDFDYTDISINEWLFSEVAHLAVPSVKVPETQRVKLVGEDCTLSYSLLEQPNNEELYHMADILSEKFGDFEHQKYMKSFAIKEIIECVRKFVTNEEDMKEIEKGIVQTVALDCLTNNVDRHGLNWGLIRYINTDRYSLFALDHALSFINMIDELPGVVSSKGYTSEIVGEESSTSKSYYADEVLRYLRKQFPEYIKELCENISTHFPEINGICQDVKNLLKFSKLYEFEGRCSKLIAQCKVGEMEHE